MIDLISAGTYFRTLFLTALFLITVVDICCLPVLIARKYKVGTVIALFASGFLGFGQLVAFTTGLYSVFNNAEIPQSSQFLLENAEYTLVFFLLNLGLAAYIAVNERRYRESNVTTLSIKESFDHLPTGLCFSRLNGTVQLVNHKMNELGYILTGEEIQNVNAFWDRIVSGKTLSDVQKVSGGTQPVYRIPGGKVYQFRRERLENVFQLTATDITGLYRLANKLQTNNEELEEMNERLRCYGETVDETTRARERLETKIRIHSELGQALLATGHAIGLPDADFGPIINTWKRNIAVLRTQTVPVHEADLLDSLIDVARSSGVGVEVIGEFPRHKVIAGLITLTATEALTNAVRHADASVLRIEISETEKFCCVRYTNNGQPPTEKICEGGGLSSLRSKIERYGGEMKIRSLPSFEMTVKLPKEMSLF